MVEVDRSDRQDRRRRASPILDAVSAARAAQSGGRRVRPGAGMGRWSDWALMVAKRTARAQRTDDQQARALIPGRRHPHLVHWADASRTGRRVAALRPRPGSMVRYHTLLSLREPAAAPSTRRPARPARPADRAAGTARAPGLLSLLGVGSDTAAMLLIAAGDPPVSVQAAWAHLCSRADPGLLGQARHRPSAAATGRPTTPCGGSSSPDVRTRRPAPTSPGAARKACQAEIIRCLKRYAARETYRHLRPADHPSPGAA
jgi:hypothetical protein